MLTIAIHMICFGIGRQIHVCRNGEHFFDFFYIIIYILVFKLKDKKSNNAYIFFEYVKLYF